MRRTILFIIIGVVMACVVVLAWFLYKHDNMTSPNSVATTTAPVAPSFSLPNMKGEEVILSKIQTRLKVVYFWASWSPYARTDLPMLAHIQDEYSGEVAIIPLNRDKNPIDGKTFLASLALGDSMHFAYDQNDEYFTKVGGYAMPEILFLDTRDTVLAHIHGPMSEESLRARIQALMRE